MSDQSDWLRRSQRVGGADMGSAEGVAILRYFFVPGIPVFLFCVSVAWLTLTERADALLSHDGDVALHILHGRLVVAGGALLPAEPASYLIPDSPYVAHEWATQVAFAILDGWLGLAGPVLFCAVAAGTVLSALFVRCRAGGAGTWVSLGVVLLSTHLVLAHMHARPHVVTWLGVFAFIGLLEAFREGRLRASTWLLAGAALLAAWAQFHGGVLVAGYLLGLYGLGAIVRALGAEPGDTPGAWRRVAVLVLGGGVFLGATALNPWGLRLHGHFLGWLSNPFMMGLTSEFSPPSFRDRTSTTLFALFALCVASLGAARRRPEPEHMALFLGTLLLALQSARHAPLFAIASAPLLAVVLQGWLDERCEGRSLLSRAARVVRDSDRRLERAESANGGVATGAILVAGVWVLAGIAPSWRPTFDPRLQPVAAAAWISTHADALPGPMFNDFEWGAYLAWRLYPERQVYVHSWHDHLGEDVMRRYLAVHAATPIWEEVLDADGVGWVVHSREGALALALSRDDDWERVYSDPVAVIHRRRRGPDGTSPE